MSPEIWQDLATRLRNLRADIVNQWQGDIDNSAIEQTVGMLGNTIRAWERAQPVPKPPAP